MNKFFTFLLLLPFALNAQIRISDVYVGGGYQFSNTEIPSNFVNEFKGGGVIVGPMFPQDSLPEFDNIKGFTNFGLGALVLFKQLSVLAFDFSVDYQSHSEQTHSVKTFSVFDGYDYNYLTVENSINDTAYDYGFEIKNVMVGFAPQAQFQVLSRLYCSVGLGVLANFVTIDQSGYQMQIDQEQWSTSNYTHSANYVAWAVQAKLVVGVKLSSHSSIDIGARYVSTALNDLEPANDFLDDGAPEGSSVPIIPIYNTTADFESMSQPKTELDLSGISVFLRYRYSFGGE